MADEDPSHVPFVEITDARYAGAFASTCDSMRTRRGYLLTGTCPRCNHRMDFLVATEIHLGRAPAAPRLALMMCTCRDNHLGRPEDDEGCGAYWNVELSGPAS